MKKILLIAVGILLLIPIVATVDAKKITLATLNYQDDDLVVETGNLTLNFHNSTNGNKSDVSILKLNYIPGYDLTVMKITSEDITYDYNFVNNTKTYVFNCTNNTNFYLVKINYSSIKVPKSPMEYYREMLLSKNETIRQLRLNLTKITNSASNFNISLKSALQKISVLEEYKIQTKVIVDKYDISESRTRNLTVEVAAKQAKIGALEEEKVALQETIDSFTTFSVTYSKDGSDVLYFNASWFLIGGILFLFLFIFFTSKKTAGIRNKSRDVASSKLHRKEVEIPDVYDVRNERPSIERDILKPIEEPKDAPNLPKEEPKRAKHEEISKDVDKILDKNKINNILNKKW
jgi:hypothetical protein